MHLAERLRLPGYHARAYGGLDDIPGMCDVLTAHREHDGNPERPSVEQMIATYTHLGECDPDRDIAVVEAGGAIVAYCRPTVERLGSGVPDLLVFAPCRPDHLTEPMFAELLRAEEEHLGAIVDADVARFRTSASHPGPGREPTGVAAWLEVRGYTATEWGASLRRPHLDDVPDLPLPPGVEVRPVEPHEVRRVWEVHHEAFRGEWDFVEPTADDIDRWVDDPTMDPSLWQVAWAGDEIVGQVKPFVNDAENAARGYRRGYTEYISTHRDWRNRGIASALLARALVALRDRGMTEAAMGVDTNNPGGALHVYTRLGFGIEGYEAVYTKPFRRS